ncbi:serine/threonine protein kinase, partial [bacterium]|nr:serine/threonine protein kinase [bacterium]
MVKAEPYVTCACGAPASGTPSPDGTVPCGACGRRVVVDAALAARAFGTSEQSPTRTLDAPGKGERALADSTGEPLKLVIPEAPTPDGVTQSIAPEPEKKPILSPRMPEKLGAYKVMGRLGAGGMGIVYRGHDAALDRPVALKVLARTGGPEDQLAGLEQEARAIAAVAHPNVVQVYSAGEQDGLAYFAMELVSGPDLREVLEREGPFSPERAKKAMIQAATGLRAAARKGIFHRDVKPANLLLDKREDQVKVADFGLAKRACVDASLAGTSLIAGTPLYVAPEVIQDGVGDQRADIYSLGATFYHLLAGAPPFGGKSAAEALLGHAKLEAPDLKVARPDVPLDLARTIRRCLEKDPRARFQSYDELLSALGRTPSGAQTAVSSGDDLGVKVRPIAPPEKLESVDDYVRAVGPAAEKLARAAGRTAQDVARAVQPAVDEVARAMRQLPTWMARHAPPAPPVPPAPPAVPLRRELARKPRRSGIVAIILLAGGVWLFAHALPQVLSPFAHPFSWSWSPRKTHETRATRSSPSCDDDLVSLGPLIASSRLPRDPLNPVDVQALVRELPPGWSGSVVTGCP